METTAEAEAPRPLAQEIPSSDGYKLVQIKREGNVAMYAQVRKSDGATITYEVIRIETKQAREVFGTMQPFRELYPSSSKWGKLGWTYPRREMAEEAFEELVRGQTRPTR